MSTKTVTLESLNLQARFVSIETVDGLTTSGLAMTKLAGFVSDTGRYIKEKFNAVTAYFNNETIKYEHIDLFTNKFKYLDAKDFIVIVPEGFKGNYKDYSDLLLKIYKEFSTKFLKEVVLPYDHYISQLVNNPVLLESLTYKHQVKVKDVEAYRKQLAKFFTPKFGVEVKLSTVFGSMNEFKVTRENTLALLTLQSDSHIVEIKKAITALDEKLNLLASTISSNSNNINVKSQVANTLSELTMELANEVEFFAVFDNMVNNFIGAMNSTEEIMRDVR